MLIWHGWKFHHIPHLCSPYFQVEILASAWVCVGHGAEGEGEKLGRGRHLLLFIHIAGSTVLPLGGVGRSPWMVLVEGLAWYLAQNYHLEHDVYHYFSLRKLFEINHGGLWPSPWPGSLIFLFLLVWSMPCSGPGFPKPGCASELDADVKQH